MDPGSYSTRENGFNGELSGAHAVTAGEIALPMKAFCSRFPHFDRPEEGLVFVCKGSCRWFHPVVDRSSRFWTDQVHKGPGQM